MAGWHHWLDGRESEWTLGVGDGQGVLVCCDSWGHKESDTTGRLNRSECIYTPGEGNGYPFQYSWLENSMDRRAWWGIVHGVAKKQMQLSNFHFFLFLFSKNFYFYFILLYNTVLVLPYIDMNQPRMYMCGLSWTALPPPSASNPSGPSQCTSCEYPVSCIKLGLEIYFTYGNIHVSMLFSNHPTLAFSHRVQKSVLYICVSFAVSHIGSLLTIFLNSIYMR